jgi:uncharacterized SAM-binding protein YcdF (DUF218 family)
MLSPLRLLVVFALCWLLARRASWTRVRRLCAVLAAMLVVLTTPFGANALVRLQESRAPSAAACTGAPPQAIVLLSGGLAARPRDEHDYAALGLASLQRLLGAVALQRSAAPLPLVIVGTSDRGVADSLILADLARSLGVDPATLQMESVSLNTWQNAQATARLAPKVPQRIWLVTSTLHMARALFAFREAGFDACAYPVQPLYQAFDGLGYLLPTGTAAVKADEALHEIIGEVVYRLRAWHARGEVSTER